MGTDWLTCEITKLHHAVPEMQECHWNTLRTPSTWCGYGLLPCERHPPGVGMVCCQNRSPALVKCQAPWPIVLCHCSGLRLFQPCPELPAHSKDRHSCCHCSHIVAGHVVQWLVQLLCMRLHLPVLIQSTALRGKKKDNRAQRKKKGNRIHIYINI